MSEVRAKIGVHPRNQLVVYGAVGGVAISIALLMLFEAGVFSFGFIGLYGIIGSLLAIYASLRRNWATRRREHDVIVSAEGVSLDGKLAVPRARIADGFFRPQPLIEGVPRAAFRLVDKRGVVLMDLDVDEARARQMLTVLGLDPRQHRADFRAPPAISFAARVTFGVVGAIGWMAIGSVPVLVSPFAFLMVAALVVSLVVPSTISVGIDGVLVRWLWVKRFIPMGEITSLAADGDANIHLGLKSGKVETLVIASKDKHGKVSDEGRIHRDTVLGRIRDARAAYQPRRPIPNVAALVDRGNRSPAEWIAHLRALATSGEGYRALAFRPGDLLDVVVDPAAPEEARVGAAVLLRTVRTEQEDEDARAKVRIAAEATASPRLRVALEAAVDADENKLEEAIVAIAGASDRK